MPDFNKLFSQSGLKMKQLKVCIVSWSVTLAGAVIKPGPALGGRLVAPAPAQAWLLAISISGRDLTTRHFTQNMTFSNFS